MTLIQHFVQKNGRCQVCNMIPISWNGVNTSPTHILLVNEHHSVNVRWIKHLKWNLTRRLYSKSFLPATPIPRRNIPTSSIYKSHDSIYVDSFPHTLRKFTILSFHRQNSKREDSSEECASEVKTNIKISEQDKHSIQVNTRHNNVTPDINNLRQENQEQDKKSIFESNNNESDKVNVGKSGFLPNLTQLDAQNNSQDKSQVGSQNGLQDGSSRPNVYKQVSSIAGLLGGIGTHQAQSPEAQARLQDPKFVSETVRMARLAFMIATLLNFVGFLGCIGFMYWFLEATSPQDFISKFAAIFVTASEMTGTNKISQKEFNWEDEMKVRMVRGGLKKLLGIEEDDMEDDEPEMLMDATGQIDYGDLYYYRMSDEEIQQVRSKMAMP